MDSCTRLEEKEIKFKDLLELQQELDNEVSNPRPNGFVPRKRTRLDIGLAMVDEFQEWLKELPKEYNFKYWKEKGYSRERELEELTDVLFFLLAAASETDLLKGEKEEVIEEFEIELENFDGYSYPVTLGELISSFYAELFTGCYKQTLKCFMFWISICNIRGFTKDEVIKTYLNKWQKNMGRINKDWSK